MKGFSHADLEKARELDLYTYLSLYEPDNLVHVSGNSYCTKEHDSLVISNGKWMWFSRGFGGYTALDYLVKVEGYSFVDAVNHINRKERSERHVEVKPEKVEERKLILPCRSYTTDEVMRYLTERGIDREIIEDCIEAEILFESYPQHHAVFLGSDENNIPRYAMHRSTGLDKSLGDCSGSNKKYAFKILNPHSRKLHVFESAIDLLSYQTLLKMQGEDYGKDNYLSLSGVYTVSMKRKAKVPAGIEYVLNLVPGIDEIHLHLDNDKAGRLATAALRETLKERVKVFDEPPPCRKDVNEYLQRRRQLEKGKEKER